MKLSIFASLFLAGTAIASAAGGGGGGGSETKTIPIGGTCKKDGSMGNCEKGFCLQKEDASEGKCKEQ